MTRFFAALFFFVMVHVMLLFPAISKAQNMVLL
ncbi:hypothetical protein MXMO3_00104 [Maritalea myrionectae]|uniref:Uncharacterized protein n=1 Tax=Maritalea myrionectae TaxID=454601 RepID=A0A2R4M9E7_9HYPH|nr:hypothetical protein MXMO3_00104 [Maritalea myrionectae]